MKMMYKYHSDKTYFMKQIILAALITSAIFAGCTKENNETLIANNTGKRITDGPGKEVGALNTDVNGVHNNIDGATNAPYGIMFQFITTRPPGALVQWNGGYMNNSSIGLTACLQVGDMRQRLQFETQTGHLLEFASPVTLGIVVADPTTYYLMIPRITLMPSNKVSALFLMGTTRIQEFAAPVPIEIRIDQPIDLTAEWKQNVTIGKTQVLTAVLSLDLAQVTNGITPGMLVNAERTNGVIVLSANSNTQLYQAIVANLQNNLMVRL